MAQVPAFQPTPVQPAQFNFSAPQQPQTNPMQAMSQGLQMQGLQQQNQLGAMQLVEARRTQQAQQQFQFALSAFVKSEKTETDFSNLITSTPPEHIAQMAKMWETFSEPKKKDAMRFSSEIVAALMTGNNDKAVEAAANRAEIYEASGMADEAAQMRKTAELAKTHPDFLLAQTAMGIVAAGGEKVLKGALDLKESREKSELHNPQLAKAKADASIAASGAKYADREHAAELAKKGLDIEKIRLDIANSKDDQRLQVMKAALDKEEFGLKRRELELKINKAQDEQTTKLRERAAELESSRSAIDNMLSTADRLIATPSRVVESATGPVSSRIPTVSSDTADFEETLETLGSQAFLAQIPAMKGTGTLSNAEGDKLQKALQSLSLRQSKEQLMSNLKEAQRLLLKGRANLTTRYGLPETTPDRPQRNIKVTF